MQDIVEELVAVARALSRNPRPLLIVSRHIQRDEALATLRPMFRERHGAEYDPDVDSELVEVWADWDGGATLSGARALLAREEPDEEALREALAARVPALDGATAPAHGLSLRRVALARRVGKQETTNNR